MVPKFGLKTNLVLASYHSAGELNSDSSAGVDSSFIFCNSSSVVVPIHGNWNILTWERGQMVVREWQLITATIKQYLFTSNSVYSHIKWHHHILFIFNWWAFIFEAKGYIPRKDCLLCSLTVLKTRAKVSRDRRSSVRRNIDNCGNMLDQSE